MALTTFFSRRQRPLNTAAVCLLMIGYTSQGLLKITGLAKNQAILLALPQWVTLICSTLALVVVLKWFNIRTIIFSGMLLALVIISQLGQIAGRTPLWLSVSQGLYGVGAGIIPLTASRAICNLGGAPATTFHRCKFTTICGGFRRRGVVIVVAT